MIHSDFHIHSEYSYDASTPIREIAENASAQGLTLCGVTDHANFNDEKFLGDLRASADAVRKAQSVYPHLILGVELTPIERPEFEYIAKTGRREGYVPPHSDKPYEIELALTKEELVSLGVRYAIGAAHWRVDSPNAKQLAPDLDATIREWYRQQLFLACDERVTILGHPWYNGRGIWYEDLSVIPRSMQEDLTAALLENGKCVECNAHFFLTESATERFRRQYAELLRSFFEAGIPVTYGSDAHHGYDDQRARITPYLAAAGFREGDLTTLTEAMLW